jgi:hypothetical protein
VKSLRSAEQTNTKTGTAYVTIDPECNNGFSGLSYFYALEEIELIEKPLPWQLGPAAGGTIPKNDIKNGIPVYVAVVYTDGIVDIRRDYGGEIFKRKTSWDKVTKWLILR